MHYNENRFYDATDPILDTNGKMSVCKDCIDELFDKIFAIENDLSKTILAICRILNVAFLEECVSSIRNRANELFEKNGNLSGLFGIYKSKLNFLVREGSLIFSEPMKVVEDREISPEEIEGEEKSLEKLKHNWGEGLSLDDYAWLESEYVIWRRTHDIASRNEETLLRLVVLKLLDIRKKRSTGADTSSLEKSLQGLLETSALRPIDNIAEKQGLAKDTFGLWIADIEKKEPAEWWEEEKRKGYEDAAGNEKYYREIYLRSMKNFMGISKDFSISEEEMNSVLNDEDTSDEDYFGGYEEEGFGNDNGAIL